MDWYLLKFLLVSYVLAFLFTDPADPKLFPFVFFVVFLKKILYIKLYRGHA